MVILRSQNLIQHLDFQTKGAFFYISAGNAGTSNNTEKDRNGNAKNGASWNVWESLNNIFHK